MRTMHLVYTSSDMYSFPVVVSAKSALIHNVSKSPMVFDIISEHISPEHQQIIRQQLETSWSTVRFIEIDDRLYAKLPNYHNSKLVWSKLYLDVYLSDVDDWVCFCDGDIMWMDDPCKLFDLTDKVNGEKYVFGSYDWMDSDEYVPNLMSYGYHIRKRDYFCLGFAMLHVGRLRAFGVANQVEKFIAKNGIPDWVEQDIFNCLFSGDKSEVMPPGWGAQAVVGFKALPVSEVKVVHFYGALPWPASCRRRLMDIHALWWYLALDLMKLNPEPGPFYMTRLIYFFMRTTNWLLRFIPHSLRGPLKNSIDGAVLPLRKMKQEVKMLFLDVSQIEEMH